MKKKAFFVIASSFLSSLCWSSVNEPWYPEKGGELQGRLDYLFQSYRSVQSSAGSFHYDANDSFLSLSAFGSLEGFGVECEAVFSDTKRHSLYLDCCKLTGRYQVYNDTVGDPWSVIVGGTAIIPANAALHDISSFHHGNFELEAHLSIGREDVCYDSWASRYWAVGAFGCATNEGSPWLRLDLAYEKSWAQQYFTEIYVKTLWGLGTASIYRDHFRGYGSIAHRSIDLGVEAACQTSCDLVASLDYSYRIYAHNFPCYTHQISLHLLYPFSL